MKQLVLAILIFLFILAGCGDKPSVSPAPVTPAAAPSTGTAVMPQASAPAGSATQMPMFNTSNFPVIDGSTATIPLGNAIVSRFLPDTEDTDIVFSGTNNAYLRLLDGQCDLVLAYEPPDEVLNYMREQNKELITAPIGRDALVFLVNNNNPIDSLTTAQIQGIYSGELTNWKQAGGTDTAIKAYQRNSTSGSQTLMKKLVMNDLEMSKPPTEYVIGEMGTLIDAIATYNNAEYAIGYNVYFYVTQMRSNELIKILSVDGVVPDNESIQRLEYPFVNDFYAAIRPDEPENSTARLLFEWLQGSEGQTLVRNNGYVPASAP